MEKNEFQHLLKLIGEAYHADEDPRNAFFPMDKLQPWERLIGGDVHDIPGGKEAWEKQQAEKAAKSAKPAEKKKLTASDEGNIYSHIDSNAFGLDDAAHAKAKGNGCWTQECIQFRISRQTSSNSFPSCSSGG